MMHIGMSYGPLPYSNTFLEPQESGSAGCGRHALNNMLGGKYYIRSKSTEAYKKEELKQLGETGPIDLKRLCLYLATLRLNTNYCPENENYDIEVLQYALGIAGYDTDTIQPSALIDYDSKNTVIGYIINFGGAHWVAISKKTGYIYKNSLGNDTKLLELNKTLTEEQLGALSEEEQMKKAIEASMAETGTGQGIIKQITLSDFLKDYSKNIRNILAVKERDGNIPEKFINQAPIPTDDGSPIIDLKTKDTLKIIKGSDVLDIKIGECITFLLDKEYSGTLDSIVQEANKPVIFKIKTTDGIKDITQSSKNGTEWTLNTIKKCVLTTKPKISPSYSPSPTSDVEITNWFTGNRISKRFLEELASGKVTDSIETKFLEHHNYPNSLSITSLYSPGGLFANPTKEAVHAYLKMVKDIIKLTDGPETEKSSIIAIIDSLDSSGNNKIFYVYTTGLGYTQDGVSSVDLWMQNKIPENIQSLVPGYKIEYIHYDSAFPADFNRPEFGTVKNKNLDLSSFTPREPYIIIDQSHMLIKDALDKYKIVYLGLLHDSYIPKDTKDNNPSDLLLRMKLPTNKFFEFNSKVTTFIDKIKENKLNSPTNIEDTLDIILLNVQKILYDAYKAHNGWTSADDPGKTQITNNFIKIYKEYFTTPNNEINKLILEQLIWNNTNKWGVLVQLWTKVFGGSGEITFKGPHVSSSI